MSFSVSDSMRALLPRMRNETHERIYKWWQSMSFRDMESYWLCFRAAVLGRETAVLRALFVHSGSTKYNKKITELLFSPQNAEAVIYLLTLHLAPRPTPINNFLAAEVLTPELVAAMDERVARLIAPGLDMAHYGEFCVAFADRWPVMADEFAWFQPTKGRHFFADSVVRTAIRGGWARALRLILERARASNGICGVIAPSWYIMMETLQHSTLNYEDARAVLGVLDEFRPDAADDDVLVPLITVCTAGVLLAMQAYVRTDDLLSATWYTPTYMAIARLDILRARRITLDPAQENEVRQVLRGMVNRGTVWPRSPLHSITLCLAPWTPATHNRTGWRSRRAAAAVLAIRRPGIAAVALVRAIVDAHRVLPLEDDAHLTR